MTDSHEHGHATAEELKREVSKALTFTRIARAKRNDQHRRERNRAMAQQLYDSTKGLLKSASLSAEDHADLERDLSELRDAIEAVPNQ